MAGEVSPPLELVEQCRRLAKAELHAHLHGSIRPATLRELVRASAALATSEEAAAVVRDVLPAPHRSLRDCFRIFDLIHAVVRTPAVVSRITGEMVVDCAADGVTYVEIRTTPRRLDGGGDAGSASSMGGGVSVGDAAARLAAAARLPADLVLEPALVEYCAAVLAPLVAGEAAAPGGAQCTARLLLSINRTGSVPDANATLALAAALSRVVTVPTPGGGGFTWAPASDSEGGSGPWVVGVDVSGDPTRGTLDAFLPLLEAARRDYGLRCTVHAGEVMNVRETAAVLSFGPDRLGHMCVLAPATVAAMVADGGAHTPPIEICPTSNALTLHLPGLDVHPTIPSWVESGVRFTLATDDSGVFDVTLSSEYATVAAALRWDAARIAAVIAAGFDAAFAPPAVIAAARARPTPSPT